MNVDNYRVSKLSHFIFGGRKNTDITARNGENIIRVKIIEQIDKTTAEKYIEDIFRRMEFHFVPEEILAIYADILTAVINLPAEIKPVRNKTDVIGKTIPYYIAYADKHLSYLIYSLDQATYRGLITLIYCDDKELLVSLEILMPVDQFNLTKSLELLNSFKC
jgi:hypothetical protein